MASAENRLRDDLLNGPGWRNVEWAWVPAWPCQPCGPRILCIRGVWTSDKARSDARTRAKENGDG